MTIEGTEGAEKGTLLHPLRSLTSWDGAAARVFSGDVSSFYALKEYHA